MPSLTRFSIPVTVYRFLDFINKSQSGIIVFIILDPLKNNITIKLNLNRKCRYNHIFYRNPQARGLHPPKADLAKGKVKIPCIVNAVVLLAAILNFKLALSSIMAA